MKHTVTTYRIKDTLNSRYISLTYDSNDPDIVSIRMPSTNINISVLDLADFFTDMDAIFADAINKNPKSSGSEDK